MKRGLWCESSRSSAGHLEHHLLEVVELGSVHSPVPLQLVLSAVDHRPGVQLVILKLWYFQHRLYLWQKHHDLQCSLLPELIVIVHPGLEALLIVGRPVLQRVGSKTDQVEVPLHEVQDQTLPADLQVISFG